MPGSALPLMHLNASTSRDLVLLGMLAIAIIIIVLRRRSVVLTRSRKVITCSRQKIVLVFGKYECPVEAMSMEKGCSSLEIMETIGRKEAGSIRCMKARKQ
ncbi:hypothetical protein HOY82DRAFT_634237 [Tuber indicum]|nr:hypothetical protein HOY82DRAFT_634237 [Tuber indicum]